MIIDGVWVDNITCKRCRRRHPASVTCEVAREVAATGSSTAAAEDVLAEERELAYTNALFNVDMATRVALEALRELLEKK